MSEAKQRSNDSGYTRLNASRPRIRNPNIHMARDLELERPAAQEPKPGDPAELTLRDGSHVKHVYVKTWDGQRRFYWQGFSWDVVSVKKSVWEPSSSAPLWWSFYGQR